MLIVGRVLGLNEAPATMVCTNAPAAISCNSKGQGRRD